MSRNIRRASTRAGNRVARYLRSFGAIAHFDPDYSCTDDGTTSTWTDRIGGEVVSSTSQATRLVYSASLSGLNNRPGWTGTYANATKLVSAGSTLASRLDGVQASTVYIVKKKSATAGAVTEVLLCAGSTALDQCAYWGVTTTSAQNKIITARRGGGGQTTNQNSVVYTGTNAAVTSIVYSGSAYTGWDNGGPSAASEANVQSPTANRLVIGGSLVNNVYSSWFDGDIGDIVIFPTAHTDAQRMYVERLLAAKYGWAVLQGLSGFTSANYLKTANGAGIRGTTGVGYWTDILIRPDAVPATTQYLSGTYSSSTGHVLYTSSASTSSFAGNSSTTAIAPVHTTVAADVGKLALLGSACDNTKVYGFWNGAEIGSGTALAGYTAANASFANTLGTIGANAATSFSIFGHAGGNLPQVAANHAARAAAIKAAQKFVATGGVAATHAWALDSGSQSYADLVGSDTMTLNGTLTTTQCIVTAWGW